MANKHVGDHGFIALHLGLHCLGGLDRLRGLAQLNDGGAEGFASRDDHRLADPEAFFQLGQIGDAQRKADVWRGRCYNRGSIRQVASVLERIVANRHRCSGDRVAAARRVGGGRGVGGVGLFLVEGDGGTLALEFIGGNLLEGFVVGGVALVGGADGRCKEAEGVPGS